MNTTKPLHVQHSEAVTKGTPCTCGCGLNGKTAIELKAGDQFAYYTDTTQEVVDVQQSPYNPADVMIMLKVTGKSVHGTEAMFVPANATVRL